MASSTPTPAGQFISLDQAKTMTALYRTQKENIIAPQFQGQNILSNCETFDRSIFDTILAETGCVSMRIYFGMDTNLNVRVIIVGVDNQNNDILPSQSSNPVPNDGGGSIGEVGQTCPPWCPPPGGLNG